MELADSRASRARRPNAGDRLQELLTAGLDSSEEAVLEQYSSASDSDYTVGSDEETVDYVESDFDDEEVGGHLPGGSAIEAEDARERREERQQRRRQLAALRGERRRRPSAAKRRKAEPKKKRTTKKQQRQQQTRDGEDQREADEEGQDEEEEEEEEEGEYRAVVRQRKAPSIALATRLAAAHARARELRHHELQQVHLGGNDAGASSGSSLPLVYGAAAEASANQRKRRRRRAGGAQGLAAAADGLSLRARAYATAAGHGSSTSSSENTSVGRQRRATQQALYLHANRRCVLYSGPPPALPADALPSPAEVMASLAAVHAVVYKSNAAILKQCHVPALLTFPDGLPGALLQHQRQQQVKKEEEAE